MRTFECRNQAWREIEPVRSTNHLIKSWRNCKQNRFPVTIFTSRWKSIGPWRIRLLPAGIKQISNTFWIRLTPPRSLKRTVRTRRSRLQHWWQPLLRSQSASTSCMLSPKSSKIRCHSRSSKTSYNFHRKDLHNMSMTHWSEIAIPTHNRKSQITRSTRHRNTYLNDSHCENQTTSPWKVRLLSCSRPSNLLSHSSKN